MKQHKNGHFGLRLRRVLSGLLCAAILCGLLPAGPILTGSAQAAEAQLSWSDQDLEALRGYEVMGGYADGQMHPERTITRAEFAAMINRAFGYKEKAAKNPFKDVSSSDWFADEVSVSYNMGYMGGTSSSTMSPQATLTRETALVILSRNLMLQPAVGESFSYADSRSFSEWSRGYIEPAIEAGIIDADRTGSFTPQKAITRGEVAGMIVRAMGTPIRRTGITSLGTVDGNVTITSSNVTLRNTTINGDLYLTGGIGLGDVLLDNVTVNGKIVDSGAGQSEKGEISVTLNNVSADELVVDSMRNQTISLGAKGRTAIPKTSVRTPTYLDDSTSTGYGLELIEIDGEDKTAVRLSGNIKEVHNKTPNSTLNIGEGVATRVTIDELAAGSSVEIGKDARVMYLNLDTGAKVTGSGTVDSLTVSADGATITLPELPDEVVVAPGIIATINRQKIDSAAAQELSSRPRFMPGYPVTDNVAPTSANAIFMTNKPGTIYWAITALASGSAPSEDELISPPSYSKLIIKSGSIRARESNTEYTAKISGLTSDGSYYLSAILVDEQGNRSAIKVTALTTPDNTTPAFAKDYPVVEASEKDAQLQAMTTKDCYLYYAVLPKGSTAPRAIDFQTGSISGNLGYGVVKMAKNSPTYLYVNDVSLDEKESYVLYLWLTDFDNAKSSAVKPVNFTTQDKTDPIVTNLRQTKQTASGITGAFSMNEQGTLYWAVVPAGDQSFMSPAATSSSEQWLESRQAMERVIAGTGALKNGRAAVAATRVGADVTFTVTGLNSKTTGTSAYDLYYVGVDAAGNWSKPIRSVTVYTEDKTAPTVAQKFTSFNEGDTEDTTQPLANTNIRLVFSKPVRTVMLEGGVAQPYNFLDLNSDPEMLADVLRKCVKFYQVPVSGSPTLAAERTSLNEAAVGDDWVIDYRKAVVSTDGTNMVVELPNNTNKAQSALNLANGATYYFVVSPQKGDVQDTTASHNEMNPATLPRFTTRQAQINISPLAVGNNEVNYQGNTYEVDYAFQFDPVATGSSPDGICYDLMLWSDTSMTLNVFWRERGGTWQMVGSGNKDKGAFEFTVPRGEKIYNSFTNVTQKTTSTRVPFYELNDETNGLREGTVYEYAVSIATFGGVNNRSEWNIDANLEVTVAAGTAADLNTVANSHTESNWNQATQSVNGRIDSIGNPDPYTRRVVITDSVAPVPAGSHPSFNMRDTSGTISMMLDRPGDIYWVVSRLNYTPGQDAQSDHITGDANLNVNFAGNKTFDDMPSPPMVTPWSGAAQVGADGLVYVTSPDAETLLTNPPEGIAGELYSGNIAFERSAVTIPLSNLEADSWYGVYMMFRGNAISEQAVCYRFKTHEAYDPILTLSTEGTSSAGMVKATVQDSSANVDARLIPVSSLANTFYSTVCSTLGNYFPNNTVPAAIANLTVLEAMMTPSGAGTMFDAHASDDLKNHVANLIASGASGNGTGSIASKQVTIPMGGSQDMSFPGLAQNSEYFCVAVATNTSDSSKRGFRAIRPVEVVDTTPPTVMGVGGGLRIDRVDNDTTHMTSFTVSGTVTIAYAGYLYVKDSTRTAYPFTQGGQTAADANKDFFPSGGETWAGVNNVTIDNIFQVLPSTQTTPALTQSLVLTVKDYSLGSIPYTEVKTPVLDKDGNQVLVDGKPIYNTSYERPDFPDFSGTILFPTVFCNRNGNTPVNTGTITYTNKSGSTTSSNVTVTYRNR